MARLAAILTAVQRSLWRELRGFDGLNGNNFFVACVVLLPQSGTFVLALLGILTLFALLGDPLRKIPPERLGLWPLSARDRGLLRLGALLLSPATWLAVGLFIWIFRPRNVAQFLLVVAVFVGAGMLARLVSRRVPAAHPFRWVPRLPGPLGGLMQKDLRTLLLVLDPYAGLLLAVTGVLMQASGRGLPDEARLGLTLLVALAFSTGAQCLFGLDGQDAMARYRLLPVRGWQVLLSKGVPYLALLVLVSLPFAPLVALAAGLAALAVGQRAAVLHALPQVRWRFAGGLLFSHGLPQIVLMSGAGVAVFRYSAWWLAPCVAGYAASLFWYGRRWERGAMDSA